MGDKNRFPSYRVAGHVEESFCCFGSHCTVGVLEKAAKRGDDTCTRALATK